MASRSEVSLYDPVRFVYAGTTIEGHVARKTSRKCTIVAVDGKTYDVPWTLVSRRHGAGRKRVRTPSDIAKSRFRSGDEVEFEIKAKRFRGTIARANPKRARVVCEDGSEFSVSYGLLKNLDSDRRRDDALKLEAIELAAEGLMARHGLPGWSFQFDDSLRRAGFCDHSTRVIGMSRLYALQASEAERKDTVLHEIAHALVGPQHRHDFVWQATARAIGCSAERCHREAFAPSRYIATCPKCDWSAPRNIRWRQAVCKECGSRVRYFTYTEAAWRAGNTRPGS